jgi:hypothetical protein
MAKKLFSCGVFIDLKKAFDTVHHKNYVITDLEESINDWFSSYP